MDNDDFTVLVSGGGRRHWMSMCTVWPSHSKWLEQQICIKFCIKFEPSSKETGWLRRLQLRATATWQLHHDNAPAHASRLMQSVLVKHQITQVTQLPYSPDWVPWDFWLFPKLKSPLKGKIPGHQWDSGKCDGAADRDWENCVRSRGAYFEGDWDVIALCTMFLVSCIFLTKCLYFSYYMPGYLLDRPHVMTLDCVMPLNQHWC